MAFARWSQCWHALSPSTPVSPRSAWPSVASRLQLSACSELTPPFQGPPTARGRRAHCSVWHAASPGWPPLRSMLSLGAWVAICPSRRWHVILDPPPRSASTSGQPRSCLSHLPNASRTRAWVTSAVPVALTASCCPRIASGISTRSLAQPEGTAPPVALQPHSRDSPRPVEPLAHTPSPTCIQSCLSNLPKPRRRPHPPSAHRTALMLPALIRLCVCVSVPQARQGSLRSMPAAPRVAAGGPLREVGCRLRGSRHAQGPPGMTRFLPAVAGVAAAEGDVLHLEEVAAVLELTWAEGQAPAARGHLPPPPARPSLASPAPQAPATRPPRLRHSGSA